MKKIAFSLTILLGVMTACTDLSEELYDQIPNDVYPENSTQVNLNTVPLYTPLRDFIDWGGWWFAQELPSDEVVCPTRLTDWDDGGKWRNLHTHEWDNKTEAVAAMWGRFYNGIYEANKLIELNEADVDNPAVAKLVAKAKSLRAYYYYLLIDNYGDVPYVTSFSNSPAEPTKELRATIWAGIVADLEESVQYLDPVVGKTAVGKGFAFSLLAKLYINAEVYTGTAQWAKAEIACDSVIGLGAYRLEGDPLGPFVTNNDASPENIFVIPYDENSYKGFNLHMRTLHYNHNLTFNMTVGPWNGFATMEDHFNTYSDNDKRKRGFLYGPQFDAAGAPLMDAGAGGVQVDLSPVIPALEMTEANSIIEVRFSGARVAKFEIKNGASDNLSNDFPLFRYADVLLMKGETMIRQSKNGDEYINMTRTRAGIDPLTGATLDDVLEERGREMFWEAHRRQDLIRFGKFGEKWWEKNASGKDRETFPIPQWAIDANPNLG